MKSINNPILKEHPKNGIPYNLLLNLTLLDFEMTFTLLMSKSKATSYVYLHVQSTSHTFDFSNVNVIAQSSNGKSRRRLEGIHTFKTDNTTNRAWDVHPLYLTII